LRKDETSRGLGDPLPQENEVQVDMSKDGEASKNNIKFTEQETENEFESKLNHKMNLFRRLLTKQMKETNPALQISVQNAKQIVEYA